MDYVVKEINGLEIVKKRKKNMIYMKLKIYLCMTML